MNSEKINSWLTFFANFGVVIGLALLILELRQTQHLAETQAAVQRLNQIQEAYVEYAISESLAAIAVKARSGGVQSLSEDDFLRLRYWEESARRRMHSQYVQYTQGYLDKETADGIVQAVVDRLPLWDALDISLRNNVFDQAIMQAAGR